MNKRYHLILPIVCLVLLLGAMVAIAMEGYYVQQLNAEWVEYTEHFVDQRQEAVEELSNYMAAGRAGYYEQFRPPYRNSMLYMRAGNYMINPDVKREKAIRILHEEIGFTREEAAGLVWRARYLRPFLGIENDFRTWKTMVEHWQQLPSLVDSIRAAVKSAGGSAERRAALRDRLNKFNRVSKRFDSQIQTEVEKASHRLNFWANALTQLLALVLAVGGILVIVFVYRKAQSAHQKFRTLFEESPDAIAIADHQNKIIQINRSFEQLFGYGRTEVTGENLDRLLTEETEEFKRAQEISQRLHKGETLQIETVRTNKAGKRIPVLISALPVVSGSEITNYFAVYIDISKLKELQRTNRKLLEKERKLRARAEASREEFKNMFEHSPVAIALLEGPDLRYTYANEAYRGMFKGIDMLNKRLEDIFPEARETGDAQILKNVFHSGDSYYAREKKIWFEKEGEEGYTELYRNVEYVPLKDQQGDTYAIQITAVDVTDQVTYRQQLQEQLEEKTTLLEEIHHRVKNNLANITGILQLEMDHLSNERAYNALQDTASRIHTLADIHELLYENENLRQIRMDVYIQKLIDHFQSISRKSDRVNVEVSVEPFELSIDEAQPLGLLLNEVIQNSYKHAFPDEREGRIYVKGSKNGSKIQLQVGDDGVGFDDSSEAERGLGLSLIENLQKQLNAEVERQISEGTHYRIQFEKTSNRDK